MDAQTLELKSPALAGAANTQASAQEMTPDTLDNIVLKRAMWAAVIIMGILLAWSFAQLFFGDHGGVTGMSIVQATLNNPTFWGAVAVGFLAQAVDGALGMAYGVTASTFLLSAGATPAAASASVHIAEVFTTGLSGVAHVKLGNVNKQLFMRLVIPGCVGAVLGVLLLTSFDGKVMKPFISAYLLIMGLYILRKALRKIMERKQPKHVGKLALFGGFVDAVGGGGWGPVVTTNLIGAGGDPRTTIGSVNFAEFFLTLTGATAFIVMAGQPSTWLLVAGLIIGGMFAAPFAALLCRSIPARALMTIVGLLITCLSIWNLYKSLH